MQMPVPGLTLYRGGDWRATEAQTETYPVTRTLDASKNGPPFQYHYTVTEYSKDDAWQLQRAWQTDAGGNVVEEYPVK